MTSTSAIEEREACHPQPGPVRSAHPTHHDEEFDLVPNADPRPDTQKLTVSDSSATAISLSPSGIAKGTKGGSVSSK